MAKATRNKSTKQARSKAVARKPTKHARATKAGAGRPAKLSHSAAVMAGRMRRARRSGPSGLAAPQLDDGLYILTTGGGAECGKVLVVGNSTTGTEYWLLYASVPSGSNDVPWTTPSAQNSPTTVVFNWDAPSEDVDPYDLRKDLQDKGYTITAVVSSSLPF